MKFAIYGKAIADVNIPYLNRLKDKLIKENIQCCVYKPFVNHLINKHIDFPIENSFEGYKDLPNDTSCMISIGGDGTFLDTIALIRDSNIPVVGINAGNLGFLSYISKDEIEDAIDEIINGNYTLEKRSLLKLETENKIFGEYNYALNDLTIHKHSSSSMITTQVYLNDEFLNSYWSDGLIIATPTGSTAYSLSCGGPIITPDSGNFIINPVAPHNLNVRPIVIPDTMTITIKVKGRNEKYLVSLDSRYETVDLETKLIITKVDFQINLLRLNNQNFLTTLRNKLMWGLDKRN